MFTLPLLSGGFSFPDDNVSEEEKKSPDFGLAAARALYSRFCRSGTFYNYSGWKSMYETRAYGDGLQDTQRYVNWFTNGSPIGAAGATNQANANFGKMLNPLFRKAFANISYDVFSPMPKLSNVLLSVLSDNDYKLECSFLDKNTTGEKKKKKAEIYVKGKYMNRMAREMGLPEFSVPFVPQSPTQMDMAERLGFFKVKKEVALEKLARVGFDFSKWSDQRRETNRDAINFHFRCVRLYTCPTTGLVKFRYVDPARLVMLWNEDNQSQPAAIGEIQVKTIQEIYPQLKEAGYNDEQISGLAKQYITFQDTGMFTQPWIFERKDKTTNRWLWMDFKVYVMEFEYLSTDYKRYAEREIKGKKSYEKINDVDAFKKKNSNAYIDEYGLNTLYEGSYIVSGNGFDMLYGWKKKPNQYHKGLCAQSSFVFDRILGASPTQRVMGLLDDLMFAMLKLRAAVWAAAPKGYTIDVGDGANIKIGGTEYDLFDLVHVHRQNGIRVVATKFNAALGKYVAKPLEENDNGLGPQGREWLEQIANIQMLIKDALGIPDAMAASPDQSAERLVGVMEGDYIAGNHANWQLRDSEREFKRKIGEAIIQQARINILYDKKAKESYEGIIGEDMVKCIEDMRELTMDQLGIVCKVMPNQKEKDAIMMRAVEMSKIATRDGGVILTPSGVERVYQLLKNDDVDEAIWFMAQEEMNARDREAANAEKMAQMTIQGQQQSAMVSEAAKRETKQMEIQMDIAKERELANIEIQKEFQLQKLKNDGNYELQLLKGEQALREIAEEARLEAQYGNEITGRV